MNFIMVLYILVGVMIGLVMGALPGLTVTMTMVLVVSLTYGWPMNIALAFIVGAFVGGVMGGSIASITLNIPGTAAAVATGFDGYPLNKRGEADKALSTALIVSLIGGLFGILFLAVIGRLLGTFALKFGSQEYFLLAVWGISLVAVLSKGNMVKGLISAGFGLLICMVGMDPITGIMRYTFGVTQLTGGFNFVAVMIGLFGMKEVFMQLCNKQAFKSSTARYKIRSLLPDRTVLKKCWTCLLWSAPIGAIIGLLPGAGGDIGALVSYGVTKQAVKKPSRPFGEGAYEGVAAPEIANDAAVGGALTTLFTLGIPGDAPTAVILSAFYLHGLTPGPTFMAMNREYFSLILIFLLVAIFAAYFVGLLGSNAMLRMLRLPRWCILAFIAILCVMGAYSLQNNIYDVLFMIIFGLIGYVMESAGFPIAPCVLATILGSMVENNIRQVLILTGGVGQALLSFVTRPISIVILLLFVGSFALRSLSGFSKKKEE
jgi:putative tricarboxylic transport membrane protein